MMVQMHNGAAMPIWQTTEEENSTVQHKPQKETPAFTPGPQFVVGHKEYSQNFINPLNKAYELL